MDSHYCFFGSTLLDPLNELDSVCLAVCSTRDRGVP